MEKYRLGIMVVDYDRYLAQLNNIKNEEYKGNCKVVAITNGWLSSSGIKIMDGFPYYDLDSFFRQEFEFLIIAADEKDFLTIREKIRLRFKNRDVIFSTEIFQIMDFDFAQYVELVKSKVSIISCNCWGGITYSKLMLKFRSPTINLRFENEEHYLRFVSNMEYYLKEEVMPAGTGYEEAIGEYPIGRVSDVQIRFVHYLSFEDAVRNWNERKTRINRENIFLMLFTEQIEYAHRFEALQGYRKVVFTPGDFGVRDQVDFSVLYDLYKLPSNEKYAHLAASGEIHLYNAIKMLNGNKDYIETRGL